MGQRAGRAGEAPQQGGGDDGDSRDGLNVQPHGRTNRRPAEAEDAGVRLLGADDTTPDLHQLTQVQVWSAAQQLLQRLTQKVQQSIVGRHGNRDPRAEGGTNLEAVVKFCF